MTSVVVVCRFSTLVSPFRFTSDCDRPIFMMACFKVGLAQGINNFFGNCFGPLLPQMATWIRELLDRYLWLGMRWMRCRNMETIQNRIYRYIDIRKLDRWNMVKVESIPWNVGFYGFMWVTINQTSPGDGHADWPFCPQRGSVFVRRPGPCSVGRAVKVLDCHVGGVFTARRCVSGLRVLCCFGLCGNSLDRGWATLQPICWGKVAETWAGNCGWFASLFGASGPSAQTRSLQNLNGIMVVDINKDIPYRAGGRWIFTIGQGVTSQLKKRTRCKLCQRTRRLVAWMGICCWMELPQFYFREWDPELGCS